MVGQEEIERPRPAARLTRVLHVGEDASVGRLQQSGNFIVRYLEVLESAWMVPVMSAAVELHLRLDLFGKRYKWPSCVSSQSLFARLASIDAAAIHIQT